jgi:hypothetical protein
MKRLQNVRVLLMGASTEELDLFHMWLLSEGAAVHASTWTDAFQDINRQSINVVVLDFRAEPQSANDFLKALRANPQTQALPVVGLGSSDATAWSTSHSRVDKYLIAPVHPATLTGALLELQTVHPSQPPAPASREELMETLVEARAMASDVRGIVRLINATAPFRFTSILRFDPGELLTSVWTFDRENPELNSFPEDATVSSSYCARVRESAQPFVMPDAALDPTVADHPARHTVLSYCGVPLHRANGEFYGTLCSYDVVPRFFQGTAVQRLMHVASTLQKHWPELALAKTDPL